MYMTKEDLDRETIGHFRELSWYVAPEAGVNTTIFARVRCRMAGAGEHNGIPESQKVRLMEHLGEEPTMWPTYEAEYRNLFPKNKPGHPAYVGDTQPGYRTVVRTDHMIHRANAEHTLAASVPMARNVDNLIGSAVSIAEAGLRNDTAGATRRRKFNTPEVKKFTKAACIRAVNGRKAKFNGKRNTREEKR
jgi:hypothetical protein